MKIFRLTWLVVSLSCVTACGAGSGGGGATLVGVQSGPTSIPAGTRQYGTDILLFNGNGTWQPEVRALRSLFADKGVTYDEVDASDLNAMTAEELGSYGVLVWPGGTGGTQVAGLSSSTKARIRQAVQVQGLNYVGFCAGAFVAVGPAPVPGKDISYGFGVFSGPFLDYYYLEQGFERSGALDVAMTMYSFADGTQRDILWYGGPVTPDVPGGVVARYPNGDAAISQLWSGNGLILLSGGHPAASTSTKSSLGLRDSDGSDLDIAWRMIQAGFTQEKMPVF